MPLVPKNTAAYYFLYVFPSGIVWCAAFVLVLQYVQASVTNYEIITYYTNVYGEHYIELFLLSYGVLMKLIVTVLDYVERITNKYYV